MLPFPSPPGEPTPAGSLGLKLSASSEVAPAGPSGVGHVLGLYHGPDSTSWSDLIVPQPGGVAVLLHSWVGDPGEVLTSFGFSVWRRGRCPSLA